MIQFLSTGGTIDKVYCGDPDRFEIGQPQLVQLLREAYCSAPFEHQTLLAKDSLLVTDADRQIILDAVRHCPHRQIIITHGTDTMVETARLLQQVTGKVIVLTGALLPALVRNSDAPFNLGFAVASVQTLPEGVYIAMNGQIYPADKVRKNRAANRFEKL